LASRRFEKVKEIFFSGSSCRKPRHTTDQLFVSLILATGVFYNNKKSGRYLQKQKNYNPSNLTEDLKRLLLWTNLFLKVDGQSNV
jgi:hypothetical protein